VLLSPDSIGILILHIASSATPVSCKTTGECVSMIKTEKNKHFVMFHCPEIDGKLNKGR
jgi:hypothetical protein